MTESTIITFHTWSQSMSHVQSLDVVAAEFLKESVSGFMDSPVGIHQGKAITAKSRKIDFSLENMLDLEEFFRKLNESNPVFLYQVTYSPERFKYFTLNPETYEREQLPVPEIQRGFWIVRYATLNEEV